MLALVMLLGEVLFQSRAVGRVGAILFLFFGSLSYIPFLWKQGSFPAAVHNILTRRDFLPSLFPYRGELWGVWTQVTYANQRHFAMAIAVLFLVLIFLAMRYQSFFSDPKLAGASMDLSAPPASSGPLGVSVDIWAGFVFSGALL